MLDAFTILTNQKNHMYKIKYIAAVLIGIAGLSLQQANATVINAPVMSILNVGNPDLTGGGNNPPYGTVTVSLNGAGTLATITFTAADSYLFGGAQAVDVNVNGAFTTGTISDANFSFAGAGQVDGFGNFNLTLDDFDGRMDAVSSVTFTISGSWADEASVLAFNTGGGNGPAFDAAAHIFPPDTTALTGFAGESGPFTHVPDGGVTVMLLGVALGALGMARRYLKS
jgi:hypothetical protein